ncbi:MAG: fasciclin domain-containing protein [Paludibacter sp.]|nr:fasciclin domain-containing protein [Paludibacter sp.]
MKNHFIKNFYRLDKLLIISIIGISLLTSCVDDYNYDKIEPSWLGPNIYDSLELNGHFTNTIKLIDDLGYTEVLKLTGSKTLFVASDSSFNEFYKNNIWGVTSYDELSLAQKKSLFNFSMINNPFTVKKLSNYNSGGVLNEGTAMRQRTAFSPLDSIPFDSGDQLPASKYWNYYNLKGIHILKDNSAKPIVYFTKEFLTKYSLTDEDFNILSGGQTRLPDDVYIFNNKIIKRDIRCKNGYIHVLKSVLVPPTNMAQYIEENSNPNIPSNSRTSIFSKLLDRFSAPYYDANNTVLYKINNPEFTDSIFVKKYFANNGGVKFLPTSDHLESATPAPNLLPFDPGWNGYSTTALEADMATMFVPTDDAMNAYLNSGVGLILKNRFHSWENIPDVIILPFLKRHMRNSFIASVPSKFSKMVDGDNYKLPVEISQIVKTSTGEYKTYTGVNGEVYVTNTVYPPVDYISVYSPVLFSDNTKIMNWAINITETAAYDGSKFAFYKLYLNSIYSRYNLFIPTDDFFDTYIDPIAYGQDKPGVLKFRFRETNPITNAAAHVTALVYTYDKTTGVVGTNIVDSITDASFLQNRLTSILDSHIVVGNLDSITVSDPYDNTSYKYCITKENDIIRISESNSMRIQGGGNVFKKSHSTVTNVFNQSNGNTYFIDKPIQPSLTSVYKLLSETPEFSEFFNLLNGVPTDYVTQIFTKQGVDYRIKFFNAFRYTVYVPTNSAIKAAIAKNAITPWETINAMADTDPAKGVAINKLIQFLKYHFQDNAVFFGQTLDKQYQSATIKTDNIPSKYGTTITKYLKIGVSGTGSSLTLTMDSKRDPITGLAPIREAHVLTADPSTGSRLYNIIVKDYIFDKLPSEYKNIDGTGGTGTASALFNASGITSSSSTVIHQIDNVLTFE